MAAAVTKVTKLGTGLLNFARPRLSTAWKYARVEMRPPGPSEWGAAAAEAANAVSTISTGKFLQWTVRETMVNAVVVGDVVFCFFIGECLGKGCLIGYPIPGAHIDYPKDGGCH